MAAYALAIVAKHSTEGEDSEPNEVAPRGNLSGAPNAKWWPVRVYGNPHHSNFEALQNWDFQSGIINVNVYDCVYTPAMF